MNELMNIVIETESKRRIKSKTKVVKLWHFSKIFMLKSNNKSKLQSQNKSTKEHLILKTF